MHGVHSTIRWTIVFAVGGLLLSTPAALAVTVDIGASQDAMMMTDDDKKCNGGGQHF